LKVEVKDVDGQGRVVIPKEWRDKYLKNGKAVLVLKEDLIEIRPVKRVSLTDYFDRVEVDIKSDLSDWHKVRKELRRA